MFFVCTHNCLYVDFPGEQLSIKNDVIRMLANFTWEIQVPRLSVSTKWTPIPSDCCFDSVLQKLFYTFKHLSAFQAPTFGCKSILKSTTIPGFSIENVMIYTRPVVPGLTIMRPVNSHTIQVQNEKNILIFLHKPVSFEPSLSPPPSISLCRAVKQGSLSTRAEMSVQSPTAQRGDSAPASPRGVMSRQATSCSISVVLRMV